MRSPLTIGVLGMLALTQATSQAQAPLPEFFGIYALQSGKLTELLADADRNDFTPSVAFVVFQRSIAPANAKLFFIPPAQPRDARAGEFKGWDDWFRQTQTPGGAMEKTMLHGVPAGATELAFRVGPYGNNPEMIRIVHSGELKPGLDQLMNGVRFWVQRAEIEPLYRQALASAQQNSNVAAPGTVTRPDAAPTKEGTLVGFRNELLFQISEVFLDGDDKGFLVRSQSRIMKTLEVGSTHTIKVLAGKQVFQSRFTVVKGMHILVLPSGIRTQ